MDKGKQKPDSILGHDPFEDLDLAWLDREEGELEIKVLGHDPLEGMGMEWLRQEVDVHAPETDQQGPPLAQETTEAEATPSITEAPAPMQAVPEVVPEIQLPETRPTEPSVSVSPAKKSRPEATFHFPADFKWGVATAAHQVEGRNTHSDWWSWEQADDHIKEGHTSGQACDWWENAEADFDRAAAMGLNTLRLSVEWSRVEPRPGEFDDSALERYSDMLRGLHARHIEPMVTLHHFTNPGWLTEQGGWENRETVALFARFVRRTVEALGQHCNLWCTINEPNVYSYLGYVEGIFPPGQSSLKTAMRVIRHLLIGHAAAYREIHTIQPHARVGFAHNMNVFDPANPRSPLDRRAARIADKGFNQAILTALTRGWWTLPLGIGPAWRLRRTLDWIGLNYYTRDLVTFDRTQRQTLFSRRLHADDAEMLDGGYGESYPQGIFRCLRRLGRLGVPIYVTENGIPDDDDDQRPRYLLAHLHQVWHAIQLCCPVMGYYHWTLVDNFEWASGWTLHFGLIALNPETQARTPRQSASLYTDVVRTNAITPQIVDTYAQELRNDLLPG